MRVGFVTLLCAASASAQVFDLPVTSTWQVSTDNGTSWNSGTSQVPMTQSNVRVRMQVSWPSPTSSTSEWLTSAAFDGYVRGTDGSGTGDSVSNINMLLNGSYQPAPAAISGRRIASDLIKIDRGDGQPLGQGGFILVGNSPITGSIVFGTPVTVFDYVLQLDGTIGTRETGLVYAAISPVNIATSLPAGFTSFNFIASTQPATIVVVPSPAGLVVAGVGGLMLIRRRW